jgi:bacteriocin-like protein
MVRAGFMEKIMSKTNDTHKTNDTAKLGRGTFDDRTLDDKELDAVTGGMYGIQQAMQWVTNSNASLNTIINHCLPSPDPYA